MEIINDDTFNDLYTIYEKLNNAGKRKLILVAERLLHMNHVLVEELSKPGNIGDTDIEPPR
jgi:hypothetical protein